MKEKFKKTNPMRILDKEKINYEKFSYEYLDNNIDGKSVAKKIGVSENLIFKTLILSGNDKIIVCLIPADKKLNIKSLQQETKIKKLEMIQVNKIFLTTGYVKGGCSPIGMKKKFPTYIDLSALENEKIIISGGEIGQQIFLKTINLINFLNIKTGNFSE